MPVVLGEISIGILARVGGNEAHEVATITVPGQADTRGTLGGGVSVDVHEADMDTRRAVARALRTAARHLDPNPRRGELT